uniref:YqaJ viral recombinase domain-containing protein n=1 Tax=Amblyomma maculatum TaxID=34609 RepID=G3MTW2_AMBMU
MYGLQNEEVAVQQYTQIMQLYDKVVTISNTGLHIHGEYSFIAASPDRLVTDGGIAGLLEVKCPSSKAGQKVLDACSDKAFCAEVINGEVCLKRTHAYFYQIQGQLGVTRKAWCDFVLWTGHLELQHSVSVQRIYFDS